MRFSSPHIYIVIEQLTAEMCNAALLSACNRSQIEFMYISPNQKKKIEQDDNIEAELPPM